MEFLVIGMDKPGSAALRQHLRVRHLEFVRDKQDSFTFGGPLINDDGATIGSVLILRFADRAMLDRHLAQDPYFRDGLFETVLIRQTRQIVPEIEPGGLAQEIERQRASY